MPYIKQEDRKKFEHILAEFFRLDHLYAISVGDMNYLITTIIDMKLGKNPHYSDFNAIIGVLECVKLELYRRRISKYEDKKWTENGDVYEERE